MPCNHWVAASSSRLRLRARHLTLDRRLLARVRAMAGRTGSSPRRPLPPRSLAALFSAMPYVQATVADRAGISRQPR
jgi:hypothetical protein